MGQDYTKYKSVRRSEFASVYNQLKSQYLVKLALLFIVVFFVIAILKPLLIGPYPILFSDDNGLHLGYFLTDYTIQNVKWKIDYLLHFTAYDLNIEHGGLKSPLSRSDTSAYHWLGTDTLGRDVLSGMCNGAATAAQVGVFSMLLSFIFGVSIGSLGGYFGDGTLKVNMAAFIVGCLFFLLGVYVCYYDLTIDVVQYSIGLIWLILIIGIVTVFIVKRIWSTVYLTLAIDSILLRVLEFFKAVPSLLMLLVILAVLPHKSIWNVIFIIALFKWPQVARYARAEMLEVRSQQYIDTVRSFGFSDWRIMLLHAIPNAIPSVIVIVAFGFSAAILLESMLSFLGLGLEVGEVTWGSLLAEARRNTSAWWLAVFPGLAIFLVVASFNIIAERINEIINPKLNDQSKF